MLLKGLSWTESSSYSRYKEGLGPSEVALRATSPDPQKKQKSTTAQNTNSVLKTTRRRETKSKQNKHQKDKTKRKKMERNPKMFQKALARTRECQNANVPMVWGVCCFYCFWFVRVLWDNKQRKENYREGRRTYNSK